MPGADFVVKEKNSLDARTLELFQKSGLHYPAPEHCTSLVLLCGETPLASIYFSGNHLEFYKTTGLDSGRPLTKEFVATHRRTPAQELPELADALRHETVPRAGGEPGDVNHKISFPPSLRAKFRALALFKK